MKLTRQRLMEMAGLQEASSVDIQMCIKDIQAWNRGEKSARNLMKTVESIIKNLGYKATDDNYDAVSDHLLNSANRASKIPEDPALVRELYPLLKESVVTKKALNENTFYVTYNRGRGQGMDLVKSEESDYTQPRVFTTFEDAKKYADLNNDMQKNSPGGGAFYWVSDKDMNKVNP